MTECLTIAGWIAQSVRFPVIVDGDTGHGGIMAVRRLVAEAIRAGLAGIRIDDQPIEGKRSTQDAGVEVVPLEQAIVRYRTAVDMKHELDPDFVIIAQCYARDAANGGMEDCLQRLRAYEEVAGVDWVQFESPHSVEEIQQARANVSGPLSFMRGKLPRFEPRGTPGPRGVHCLVPCVHARGDVCGAVDFMQDFQARGLAAREAFQASRHGRPYPTHCAWTSEKPWLSSGNWRNGTIRPPCWRNTSVRLVAVEHRRKQRGGLVARNGYQIFNSDTHVGPAAEILTR